MNQAYLLLGTNLGDRFGQLGCAASAIKQEIGDILQYSAVYETAAWGNAHQPAFLNQVVLVATELPAPLLLKKINEIEEKLGRVREMKGGSRLMDIDILFFNDEIIDIPGLQIPHSQLKYRKFALMPMNEIAYFLVHPVLNKTISQLLEETSDTLSVLRYKTPTNEQQAQI